MKNYTYLLIENGDFLMRKKHNKIRNTGLLYEFLLRQITADVLNKDDKSKAISIVKSRFNETTELGKELMNKIINETKDIAKVESQPKFEGKQMVMIIQPI